MLEADVPPPARAQQQTLGLGYRSATGRSPVLALSAVGNGEQHGSPGSRLFGSAGDWPAFRGYIALESDEGLLLVDQHAAHERVTFERLKAQLGGGGVEVQAQLVPETLEINPARAAQVHAAIPKLRALGFDIEPFGPTTLLLKGTPAVFGAGGGLRLLSDMIESLGDGSPQWRGEEGFEALLKQLACHGSVRVGRILKDSEIQALLADLDRTRVQDQLPAWAPGAYPLWTRPNRAHVPAMTAVFQEGFSANLRPFVESECAVPYPLIQRRPRNSNGSRACGPVRRRTARERPARDLRQQVEGEGPCTSSVTLARVRYARDRATRCRSSSASSSGRPGSARPR